MVAVYVTIMFGGVTAVGYWIGGVVALPCLSFCQKSRGSGKNAFNLEGSWTAKDWFRLRVIGREHPELALSFNAVRCKVCMINGKNYRKKFTLRQIHERAIGKIHGSIPIARHQTVHVLQFRMFDCTDDQCSGTDEPPGGLHIRARIANEV